MTASNDTPIGAELDLYLLSRACGELSRSIVALIRGDLLSERSLLANQGFVMPAESALLHAAAVFDWLSLRPGHQDAIFMVTPSARLELVTDLITNWDGLHEAIDLGWSNHWSAMQAHWARVVRQAREAKADFMGRGHEEILARMQADQDRHFNDESRES